ILVIFAHEVGHFVKHHIPKGIILNGLLSLAGFYLVHIAYELVIDSQHLLPYSLAALPWLGLFFLLYGMLTEPLSHAISRRFEYQADHFAVSETGQPQEFIRSMEKLARLNLADETPHPLIEKWMYSHPSITHRIEKITGVSS
ncbi:MAG: M48 family metalloprotease, partial [Calditrichia bacterium]